jgi:serine/threonine-protein kinase HipA
MSLNGIGNLPEGLPALRKDEPEVAYVIERFDRLPNGTRMHFEDLNQVAGQFPGDKYEKKATEYVAQVVAELCPPQDLDELITRIVFGIAIANNDMHLKNWAIVYPQGEQPRIAPLYDFVCTKLYFPQSELNLSVGGEKAYSLITNETLTRFANRAELSSRHVRKVAGQAVERIRDTWGTFKQTMTDTELVTILDRHMDSVPLLSLR